MNLADLDIKKTRNSAGFYVLIEGAGRTTTKVQNLLEAIASVYETLTLRQIDLERLLPWIAVINFDPEPEQNLVYVAILPPCSECGREINQRVFVNLSLMPGPMNQLLACPCSKCGRLHWSSNWLPAINGTGDQALFFKDGLIAHKDGAGQFVFDKNKPQIL